MARQYAEFWVAMQPRPRNGGGKASAKKGEVVKGWGKISTLKTQQGGTAF